MPMTSAAAAAHAKIVGSRSKLVLPIGGLLVVLGYQLVRSIVNRGTWD
jgi:hypothetical protein